MQRNRLPLSRFLPAIRSPSTTLLLTGLYFGRVPAQDAGAVRTFVRAGGRLLVEMQAPFGSTLSCQEQMVTP